MASKQLGKLRQWAGEVMSTREKTQTSKEFTDLEETISARKRGLEKLTIAAEDYHAYVSRKIHSEALPGETKMMHTEALGVVMIAHGEELGDESPLGRSLTSFGRARCRIAAMQETFSVTFTDTFVSHLRQALAELDDYALLRKKLESRRLTYDAAITKADKQYKKEKDRNEAEEELEKAKARYEEIVEDVNTKMKVIYDSEAMHLRELEGFLQLETKFVEQYLEALREVKADLSEIDHTTVRSVDSTVIDPYLFSQTMARKSSEVKESRKQSPAPSRFGSARSKKSNRSNISDMRHSSDHEEGTSESEYEMHSSQMHSTPSLRDKPQSSSKVQGRQPKSLSRSGSTATIGSQKLTGVGDGTESGKSKQKKKNTSGMAGWVGDAMTNVMSRSKNKVDRENFEAMQDESDSDEQGTTDNGRPSRPRSALSNRSTKSNRSNTSGKGHLRSRSSGTSKDRKLMKALFDFSGSNDELSFKAGDEIEVLNEVLDDWWLGEIDGRKGLFPTNYTTAVKSPVSKTLPPKSKNASASSILALTQRSYSNRGNSSEDEGKILVNKVDGESSMDDRTDSEADSDWHPFDDRHRSPVSEPSRPTSVGRSATPNSIYPATRDTTLTLSTTDKQLNKPPSTSAHRNEPSISHIDTPIKKAPPPPPPRRPSSNALPRGPPPLPARNLATSNRAQSMTSVPQALVPPIDLRRAHSENNSPFESQSELSFDEVARTSTME